MMTQGRKAALSFKKYLKMRRKKLMVALAGALVLMGLQAQAKRVDLTINSGWFFHDGTDCPELSQEMTGWQRISLPHSWNVDDAFADAEQYDRGLKWYAYILRPQPEWEGRSVYLHFEGANAVAKVYVGDQQVAEHIGGYTAFRVDLAPYLDFSRPNVIRVSVDNTWSENVPPMGGDYTIYGGLYRSVRLIVPERTHFDLDNMASDGVFVQASEVSADKAVINIKGSLSASAGALLCCEIVDAQGKTVAQRQRKLTPKDNGPFSIDGIVLKNPRLWSPQQPNLYKVRMTLREDEEEMDRVELPLGLRWYSFTSDGFFLNGEKFFLHGVNRHQDYQGLANALTDSQHEEDFKAIKDCGFNFVRLAHYPQAQKVYQLCDQLGLIVWSEVPVGDGVWGKDMNDNAMQMQREQIRQTTNHPCVLIYGYMNEVITQWSKPQAIEKARVLATKLDSLTKAEAPGRYTAAASPSDAYDMHGLASIPDIIGYNLYQGWYQQKFEDLTKFLLERRKLFPNKAVIVSETGAGSDIAIHSYHTRPWDFSEEYQAEYCRSHFKQLTSLDWLCGYAVWCMFDFGSFKRQNTIINVNQKGLYTFDRKPKDAAMFFRANLSKEPFISIAGKYFTHRGALETRPGRAQLPIVVYSNAETVTLSIDGQAVATEKVVDGMAQFSPEFRDGLSRLEAVGDRGQKAVMELQVDVIPRSLSEWRGSLAVNVGSEASFTSHEDGTLWLPDRVYEGTWGRIGGKPHEEDRKVVRIIGMQNNVKGTIDDELFQTFTEGIESYVFDVPDGQYRVTLCLVESNNDMATKDLIYELTGETEHEATLKARSFSVKAGGETVIGEVNLARDFGCLRAARYSFVCTVRSGLRIDFEALKGETTLSGIKIETL